MTVLGRLESRHRDPSLESYLKSSQDFAHQQQPRLILLGIPRYNMCIKKVHDVMNERPMCIQEHVFPHMNMAFRVRMTDKPNQ